MTRIIAGSAGGRRLKTPPGDATRPTSDRVREALFSAVESWCGSWDGLAVLDLYAGSGAVGLEAISRGADRATLVERDNRTASLIRENARVLTMTAVEVHAAAVATFLAPGPVGEGSAYDLVFLDPPYSVEAERIDEDLQALADHGWLAEDALVVVERYRRSPEPTWPAGTLPVRKKRYGETTLWYGRADSGSPAEDLPEDPANSEEI